MSSGAIVGAAATLLHPLYNFYELKHPHGHGLFLSPARIFSVCLCVCLL